MGIGAALSDEAAKRGLNLLMLARTASRLEHAAAPLRDTRGVEVRTLAADLTPPEQVATRLYDQIGSGPVCFADPDDEFVSRRCMSMPRIEAIEMWRGGQENLRAHP